MTNTKPHKKNCAAPLLTKVKSLKQLSSVCIFFGIAKLNGSCIYLPNTQHDNSIFYNVSTSVLSCPVDPSRSGGTGDPGWQDQQDW